VTIGRSLSALTAVVVLHAAAVSAQPISYRGFIDGRATVFPQDAVNDTVNAIGDGLARLEISATPAEWLRLAGGLDARANSHEQVEDSWRLDVADRGALRPRLSVRRLAATLHRGPLTADPASTIRWGKADIVTPTDRFAPRDFSTSSTRTSWPSAARGPCSKRAATRSMWCGYRSLLRVESRS
jgi:hypothetical protein